MNDEAAPGAKPGQLDDAASLDRRVAKGAAWMLFARVSDRSIGLISTVTLAHLLTPADFGLVALASAVVGVLELLQLFGFDSALIQNRAATREHYNTAWTFNIALGGLVAGGLLIVAPAAATFYEEPRLVGVLACLALATFVQGFENVGVVAFRKNLELHREFNLLLLKRVVVFAVTIPLAFVLHNYWALVVGIVLGRVMGVALTYWLHEYRPWFSWSARRNLFGFGKWLVLSGAVNFVTQRGADFIVGKMAGAHGLGVFNVSYEIASLPTSDLIAPINRAVFPGYTQKAHDLTLLRTGYLDVMGMIALLAAPAGIGIAAVADLAVPLLLGPDWVECIPIVATLAFYGLLVAFKSNGHYVYLALGKPKIATYLGGVQLVILVPAVAIGAMRGGALGAAVGYIVAQAAFSPISVTVLRRVLHLRMSYLAVVVYRPLIAAAIMYAGVRLVTARLGGFGTGTAAALAVLITAVVAGALLYAGALYVIWRLAGKPEGAEPKLLAYLRPRIWARVRRLLRTNG